MIFSLPFHTNHVKRDFSFIVKSLGWLIDGLATCLRSKEEENGKSRKRYRLVINTGLSPQRGEKPS
jgi:hypothetical protein